MSTSAILCVDDEAIILDTLREQLRRHFGARYLYETALSAHEAWDVIDALYSTGVRILIIVSDWLMPGIKGDEFLAQVHARYPQIVTVMLTGHAADKAILRARNEANLFACIYKPWSEDELLRTISAALK